MAPQTVNNLFNFLPENAIALTEKAFPLVSNVTSTAIEALSDLSYFQIGGMGLLMSAGGYLTYQFPYARDLYIQAQPLMHGNMSRMGKIYILLGLPEIPLEERKDVIQRASPLIHDNMDPFNRVQILHAIHKIPLEERDDVIQRALLLMPSDIKGRGKAALFDAIREIPSKERDDVIQQALLLIRDDMIGNFEKSSILKAIRQTPSEERDDVIQQALPLISPDMKGDWIACILYAIQRIPSQERRDVIELALPFLQGDLPGWKQVEILDTVQKIPSEERRDILKQTLLLLQTNTCKWNQLSTLKAVLNIPSEERADVIQLALSLVANDEIVACNKFPLLEDIRKILPAARNSKAEQIPLYWQPKNYYDYRCLYGYVLNKKGNLHSHFHYIKFFNDILDLFNTINPHIFNIVSYAKTIDEFIELQKTELSSIEIEFLRNYSVNIHRALNILKETDYNMTEKNQNQMAEKIYQEIQQLAPGELYSIASGWKGHAVVYDIVREEQGFTFTIVNTGDDEKNCWERKNTTEPENDYAISGRYPHKGYKIDNISIKLVKHLLPLMRTPTDQMLEYIDAACKELNGKEQNGRLHKFQMRNNCAQKCLTSSFKGECLRQLGPDAGNYLYERFRLYHSEKLEAQVDEIEKNIPVHDIMKMYEVTDEQKLYSAIAERKLAVKEQITRRREKVRMLAPVH